MNKCISRTYDGGSGSGSGGDDDDDDGKIGDT